jgi:hypothetical protein
MTEGGWRIVRETLETFQFGLRGPERIDKLQFGLRAREAPGGLTFGLRAGAAAVIQACNRCWTTCSAMSLEGTLGASASNGRARTVAR